ncbi:MAG TPA: peptide-N4-asparagine amidase [Oleiagrimonas sp.]|nr:peptide-N4-asparagine amidase [Oleiagrimonas sp.]
MKHVPLLVVGLCAVVGLSLVGQPGLAHADDTPAIGSSNVAVATPDVPRPDTEPCVVQLLDHRLFGKKGDSARMDSTPHPVDYQPPSDCAGPWAKVVLEVHFSVDAGHQYDRTASIWFKGVNLYFGTTQEPSPGIAHSWGIARDLTDYSALLREPGTMQININNWIGPVFSSPMHASAKLLFYPASKAFPAPRVADRIYALNGKGATPAKLDRGSNRLSRTLTFPRNTTRVYMDVFAEPQSHDEFYYVCLDSDVIERIGQPLSSGSLDRSKTCDGGTFREVLVSIDGQAAGLAPVTPWLYTGALNPFLWQPSPAPESLNFVPWRVNLSPFAGALSDGKPHTVSLKVVDTPHFFSLAGTLLVYQDKHVEHTGGAVTRNTLQLADLTPTRHNTLTKDANGVDGGALTRASTHYVIEGYVNTPDGRVQSRVETTIDFDNTQRYATDDNHHTRHISWQHARVDSTSRRSGAGTTPHSLRKLIDYTLDAHTLSHPGQGMNLHRAVQVRQRFQRHIEQRQQGLPPYIASMSTSHIGAGKLTFQRGKRATYTSDDQSSTQNFRFSNSLGDCYRVEVRAKHRKVTGITRGQGCIDTSPMHWFVHPDGSPDSFGWRGIVTPTDQ